MAVDTKSAALDREQYVMKLVQLLLAWRNSACSVDQTAFCDLIGPDVFPKLLGRLLVLVVENGKHAGQLNQIYSETTVHERRFLYNFFASVWAGRQNVLEVGPFLGGTTRAIAMGMMLNPMRSPSSRLYTYDKFVDYYKAERFDSLVNLLVEGGLLGREVREGLSGSTSFKEIFDAIHEGHEYYSLIELNERALPESADEAPLLENLFELDSALRFDAIFVDGCKSWYSTKHFMKEAADCAEPGAYFIFQDYGWYTCFWIPVFLRIMSKHFKLLACVDNTYTFKLLKPLDKDELDKLYPDSPESLGWEFFDALFTDLISEAAVRDDSYAQFVHQLHHAAALAYIGDLDGARSGLDLLSSRPYPPGYKELIRRSRESPTYNSQGPIYL